MLLCCLRRNVEAFCHKHFVVVSRHKQTPPLNYQRLVSTRHGPSQLNVLHLMLETFTARDGPRYWLIIAIFAYPTYIRRPRPLGGSRRNIAMSFGTEKLEWFGYSKVKIF